MNKYQAMTLVNKLSRAASNLYGDAAWENSEVIRDLINFTNGHGTPDWF